MVCSATRRPRRARAAEGNEMAKRARVPGRVVKLGGSWAAVLHPGSERVATPDAGAKPNEAWRDRHGGRRDAGRGGEAPEEVPVKHSLPSSALSVRPAPKSTWLSALATSKAAGSPRTSTEVRQCSQRGSASPPLCLTGQASLDHCSWASHHSPRRLSDRKAIDLELQCCPDRTLRCHQVPSLTFYTFAQSS